MSETPNDNSTDKRRGKKPKVARTVVIPEDRPLSIEEFVDLRDHAYNSAFWNVTHYSRTEKQVVDKLLSKGYTRGEVFYLNKDGERKALDIISWVLKELKERELLGDEDYTERFVSSKMSQGWGMSRIRMEALRKGIERDTLDKILEEIDFSEEENDALGRELERALRSSAVQREENHYKRSQRVMQTLMRKGFSYGDIREKMEELNMEDE